MKLAAVLCVSIHPYCTNQDQTTPFERKPSSFLHRASGCLELIRRSIISFPMPACRCLYCIQCEEKASLKK
jgi:hypothetical protein